MKMIRYSIYSFLIAAMLYLSACSPAGGEKRGHEFMPDMVHSTAYEANIYNYYYYNTWGSEEDYHKYAQPRLPVKGTVPRGYAGISNEDGSSTDFSPLMEMKSHIPGNNQTSTPNGAVPYYYDDTEEGRTSAMAEIIENPFPITTKGLTEGAKLYGIYCAVCHGPQGDGLGYLVRDANPQTGDPGGKYPAQPANLMLDEFVTASNGRYYHSIVRGRNMMGPYADKLSYEERWQVIHYIRSLQAKAKGLEYSEQANTLNNNAVPGSSVVNTSMEEQMNLDNSHDAHEGQMIEDEQQGEGEHATDEGHGEEEEHH